MDLMVQDLTNPMLAQIPHVLLGAHAGTIRGVESNGMQFIPMLPLCSSQDSSREFIKEGKGSLISLRLVVQALAIGSQK